jgi:hypothetical protein
MDRRRGTCLLGEGSNHDTLASVLWTSGESLPQVLGDVGHVWVKQLESSFETRVECVLSRDLFGRLDVALEQWLRCFLQSLVAHSRI